MTIKELLKKGALFLNERESAVLDSEILLSHVLGESREYLLAHSDEEVEADLEKLLQIYWAKVEAGMPIAYITHNKEFFGMNFFVDERVLVPRPETEMLVEAGAEFLQARIDEGAAALRLLDVGTGSGNIPIALVSQFPDHDNVLIEEALAVDVSEDALAVARINIGQYGLTEKVHAIESDLLAFADEGEHFDLITANLPYIGLKEHDYVEDDVKKFQPESALFAGDDGLDLYRRFFQEMADKKISFGMILGEFGATQKADLAEILAQYFGENFAFVKDLANNDRMFKIIHA